VALVLVASALVAVGWLASAAGGQAVIAVPAPSGYDVSYPQCGPRGSLAPEARTFAVVGVNGGSAETTNPCLGPSHGQPGELSWASGSPGLLIQPRVSFYLDAADPGPQVADWPAAGSRPLQCEGTWSSGCAYDYGYNRAASSLRSAQLVAIVDGRVHLPTTDPVADPWWLDVEVGPRWAPHEIPGWSSLNIEAVEGFIEGLRAGGVPLAHIGFYSTAFQWQAITSLDPAGSRAYFLTSHPDWVPGATSLEQARLACSPSRSFSSGDVTLTQFTSGAFDGDYRCP
jgi:hypothetical protein